MGDGDSHHAQREQADALLHGQHAQSVRSLVSSLRQALPDCQPHSLCAEHGLLVSKKVLSYKVFKTLARLFAILLTVISSSVFAYYYNIIINYSINYR